MCPAVGQAGGALSTGTRATVGSREDAAIERESGSEHCRLDKAERESRVRFCWARLPLTS
jgi:hypothetical protein